MYDDYTDDDVPFHSGPYSVGDTLPDFTLSAYHKDDSIKINLKDYRGKWLVLFFYPADFTFICPTELEELADLQSEFSTINTDVLAVSCDTVFVHKAWHDSSPAIGKITFPMIADTTGALARSLGVYKKDEGLALRGTFIIDPQGVVQATEINSNDIGRSARELLRKVQAAQYVSTHEGQVCPASWQPGEPTLTPSIKNVGKS